LNKWIEGDVSNVEKAENVTKVKKTILSESGKYYFVRKT